MSLIKSKLSQAVNSRILLLAAIWLGAAHAAEVVTLEGAVKSALENSRRIAQAKLEEEKASLEIDIAKTRRLPVFSANILASQSLLRSGLTLERGVLGEYPNIGPIPGRTSTLTVPRRPSSIVYATAAQPLSQQIRAGLGIRLAKVGQSAAQLSLRQQELDTARDVRTLYLGILQLESRAKSLEASRKFLERLESEVTNYVAQRMALKADLLAVQVQRAEVELGLVKLREPIHTQRAELNRLMGRDPDDDWECETAAGPAETGGETAELYSKALDQRPEVRLAELQVRKADLDARMKNAERIPDVSLTVTTFNTANLGGGLPGNLAFAGVQMSWDVFDWGRKRTEVRQKRLAQKQAELEKAEIETRIKVDVGRRQRKVQEAGAEVKTAQAVAEAATEALRVTTNRYQQKEALLSDVLKKQAELADAETRSATARLTLATAQAELKRALGE